MLPYTLRKLFTYAESYEVVVKGTVVGRAFETSEGWVAIDFNKDFTAMVRDRDEAADLVYVVWHSRVRGQTSSWDSRAHAR